MTEANDSVVAAAFWVTLAPGPSVDVWTEQPKLIRLADGHTVRYLGKLATWWGSYPMSAVPSWIKTLPAERECVRHG